MDMRWTFPILALLAAVPSAIGQEQDEMKPGLIAEFFNIGAKRTFRLLNALRLLRIVQRGTLL
jgi:hypothetical protein